MRASEMSPAEKWRSVLAPLHFGFYGSTPVKWLYALGGLAPAVLAISGTVVWYLRRRRSRLPARAGRTGQEVGAAGRLS